jgi:iron complex outermembrane receptor protein
VLLLGLGPGGPLSPQALASPDPEEQAADPKDAEKRPDKAKVKDAKDEESAESPDKERASRSSKRTQQTEAASGIDESIVLADIPMVFSAVKHLQRATEAPSAVTVISAAEIERNSYRTLGDALQTVRGFYVWSDRNYNYTGVRGFSRPGDYDTRVLVMVNGHRINDSVYDQFSSDDAWSMDMNLVDSIEVIRGPGSSLYGTNAFFAVVNVITKSPQLIGGTNLRAELGDLGRRDLRLAHGEKYDNGWEVLVSGSLLDTDGEDLFFQEFDDPATNDGVFENGDYTKSYRLFSAIKKNRLSAQVFYNYRNKGIPTGSFGTLFNDDGNQTNDVRAFGEVRYERPIDGKRDFIVRGYYDHYRYWGSYLYDNAPSPAIESIERSTGQGVGEEFQFNWQYSERQRVTFGQQLERTFKSSLTAFDSTPSFLYLDTDEPYTQTSVYVQDELKLNSRWHLTAGARYDYYSRFGGTLNPRVAVVYSPSDRQVWKFLAGSAFRGPTTFEQFFEDGAGGQQIANPDLEAETIRTLEVVLEQRISPRFTGTVSVFRSTIDDLISQVDVGGGVVQFQNVDEAVSQGVELEARGRFANRVGGYLSYAYSAAEDGSGNDLTNNSRYALKFGVNAPLLPNERLLVSLEGQLYDGRLTLGGDKTPDAFLANLSFHSPALFEKVKLTATVYNLFDEEYFVPASADHVQDRLIQEGRSFTLVANYHF